MLAKKEEEEEEEEKKRSWYSGSGLRHQPQRRRRRLDPLPDPTTSTGQQYPGARKDVWPQQRWGDDAMGLKWWKIRDEVTWIERTTTITRISPATGKSFSPRAFHPFVWFGGRRGED